MVAFRGAAVPVAVLRGMSRLPGTREELLLMAKTLGADPRTAVYLGEQATKPRVIELNRLGRLGRARVLAFATHALLAGDLEALAQPALVLSPPAEPTDEDDGLLSLEDVLGLRLPHTDWVILSACNTAADDGSGEALSGLARAFFFAGARALLVSHWGVDDTATRTLMTELFLGYARAGSRSRGEALRRAMLAVLKQSRGDTAYFAHPFAWAPFFLVGED
jgi:CHAT domain-containing protein